MRLEVLRLEQNPRILRSSGNPAKKSRNHQQTQSCPITRNPPRTQAERKRMFRSGDETEERDPLSWIDLKDSPNSKKTSLIPGSCCRIRDAASVRILQATRDRQNTLNTNKRNYAVDENDRASATTDQHQDSQHRL